MYGVIGSAVVVGMISFSYQKFNINYLWRKIEFHDKKFNKRSNNWWTYFWFRLITERVLVQFSLK
jgi:hypothetical protein